MAWLALAGAAVPYVTSMLQDKPSMPGAPAPVRMADRSGMINQIIDSSFNPQNDIWVRAQERTMDGVNRALGRRGGLGSSLAMQVQNNAQAELANQWLESEAARRTGAFNAITGYDRGVATIEQQNNQMAYNHAMAAYQDQLKRNQNQIAGISGLVNAGVQAYNQHQMMDRLNPTPSYGIPEPVNYTMPELGSSAGYNYQPNYTLGVNYGL